MSAPVCTIAVIVPVHNAAKYLPDCLDAIAAQQFDDFCCVLVDDGPRRRFCPCRRTDSSCLLSACPPPG